MTKETKVGLVIGLVFMVGVVYVLSWFKPSEFQQQVAEYRAGQRAADLRALTTNKIPLSAAKNIEPSEETAKTAVDVLAQKKDVKDLPKPPVKPPAAEKTVVAAAQMPRHYVVKKRQTLSDVAEAVYGRANRHEWRRIHEANKYKVPNPHIIWPDLKLLIPPLAKRRPTDIKKLLSPGAARTYTVVRYDTLSEISSKKLGTARRWRAILALNKDKLSSEYDLRAGMVLRMPAVSKRSGFRLP